jgi:hypothetical protein
LVALLGGVVVFQIPRALLFQQVLEAAGGLLRVVFRWALDSLDSVVGLALAIGARLVAAATALVPVVVVVVAARVLLALATDGVVLGVGLVFFISQEVIMSLRWVMELGRRRPKSSKVRRW